MTDRKSGHGDKISEAESFLLGDTALMLYPSDDQDYIIRFKPFRKFIRRVITLNYDRQCHEQGIKNTERLILDTVRSEGVTVVFSFPFGTDFQLSVPFYARLRQLCKVVFWLTDDASYFDAYSRYYAQAADLMVTTDPLAVYAYKRLGMRALAHLDVVPNNLLRPVEIRKDIDVLFMGDMSKPGRVEQIRFLKDNGIDVRDFGIGSSGGHVPFSQLSDYFCRSRIILNFSRVSEPCWINSDEPLLNRVRQNTGRPKEAALTGSFCLSEFSPALDSVLRIGEEIAVFYNKEDLLQKVRYYLAHPEERERIAGNALKRARAEHEPEAALAATLKKVSAALAEPLPPVDYGGIYLSRSFRRKTVNSLTFSMFVMLQRGKFRYALETFLMLFRYGALDFTLGFCGGLKRALLRLAARPDSGE